MSRSDKSNLAWGKEAATPTNDTNIPLHLLYRSVSVPTAQDYLLWHTYDGALLVIG